MRPSILRLCIRFGIVAPFVLALGVALARGSIAAALNGWRIAVKVAALPEKGEEVCGSPGCVLVR